MARRSARGTVALALALALGIGIGAMGAAAGCGGASGGSTNPTATDETTTVQGVAFRHPAGWTSKEDIGSDGTGSVQLGPSSPTGSAAAMTLVFTGPVTDLAALRAVRNLANGGGTVRRKLADRSVVVPGADAAYLYDRVVASTTQPQTTVRLADLTMIRDGHEGIALGVLVPAGAKLDVDAVIRSVRLRD